MTKVSDLGGVPMTHASAASVNKSSTAIPKVEPDESCYKASTIIDHALWRASEINSTKSSIPSRASLDAGRIGQSDAADAWGIGLAMYPRLPSE